MSLLRDDTQDYSGGGGCGGVSVRTEVDSQSLTPSRSRTMSSDWGAEEDTLVPGVENHSAHRHHSLAGERGGVSCFEPATSQPLSPSSRAQTVMIGAEDGSSTRARWIAASTDSQFAETQLFEPIVAMDCADTEVVETQLFDGAPPSARANRSKSMWAKVRSCSFSEPLADDSLQSTQRYAEIPMPEDDTQLYTENSAGQSAGIVRAQGDGTLVHSADAVFVPVPGCAFDDSLGHGGGEDLEMTQRYEGDAPQPQLVCNVSAGHHGQSVSVAPTRGGIRSTCSTVVSCQEGVVDGVVESSASSKQSPPRQAPACSSGLTSSSLGSAPKWRARPPVPAFETKSQARVALAPNLKRKDFVQPTPLQPCRSNKLEEARSKVVVATDDRAAKRATTSAAVKDVARPFLGCSRQNGSGRGNLVAGNVRNGQTEFANNLRQETPLVMTIAAQEQRSQLRTPNPLRRRLRGKQPPPKLSRLDVSSVGKCVSRISVRREAVPRGHGAAKLVAEAIGEPLSGGKGASMKHAVSSAVAANASDLEDEDDGICWLGQAVYDSGSGHLVVPPASRWAEALPVP
eukprot:TRINITY_DN54678_c0_g1_i1.p1 TRINITY_DN54678_c0_g1~~TRINITY_DN54678_c0_g1_i1.p1  ORF type:complete len:571 (-),score=93.41 TRINITY_DN54678_c0_g1_i1:75-1787(-)